MSRHLAMATTAALASATRPVVLGLTGSIGMGKSTASKYFLAAGFRVHDADALVHALYLPGGAAVDAVCKAFPGVRSEAGGVDRTALSEAVATAGCAESLKKLERIVHPLVTADRTAFIERAGRDGEWLVILDIPLLMETMDSATRADLLDALVVVSAPADVQRARVLARPGMSAEKLDAILARQIPDATKREAADFIVETIELTPARAQLAACLEALCTRHASLYGKWRANATTVVSATGSGSPVLAVSFDLDDTLWPTMPPILAASAVLAEAMREKLPKCFAAGCAERQALADSVRATREAEPLLGHDMTALRARSLRAAAIAHGDPLEVVNEVRGIELMLADMFGLFM